MGKTVVSCKFQVVIPKEVREKASLRAGQKLAVFEKGGVIHLVPEIPAAKLRGIFKGRGIEPEGFRDKSDRPPARRIGSK